MQAKIDTLRVKDENDSEYLLYPKTLTKSVIDEDGNTLDNMLTDLEKRIGSSGSTGSGGSTSITVDTAMSDTSTNPVQNAVIKAYVDAKEVTVSSEADNAIESKEDGIYVADKSAEIAQIQNDLAPITKYQKYVNTELDYGMFALHNDSTVAYGSLIPFDVVVNGNMEYDTATCGIKLKGGKTYEMICTLMHTAQDISTYVSFHNITTGEDIPFTTGVLSGYDTFAQTVIYEAPSDCEVGVKLTWSKNNTSIVFRGFTSDTAMYNSYFTVKEINRAITIDPLNYVNENQGIEDAPVGHIISFMGNNAPAHYLTCDGTEYNISDYPYLAQHFIDQFGSVNHFGGDGTTTFAVPDLRGEFLRGTGTALRNTGTGGAVGEHQDPTQHLSVDLRGEGHGIAVSNEETYQFNLDVDSVDMATSCNVFYSSDLNRTDLPTTGSFTSRPTNTAVLYCIKYEPTYFMVHKDYNTNYLQPTIYSEEERVVGCWINGKPLYEKTIKVGDIAAKKAAYVDISEYGADYLVVKTDGTFGTRLDDGSIVSANWSGRTPSEHILMVLTDTANQRVLIQVGSATGYTNVILTIQYTKTTDAEDSFTTQMIKDYAVAGYNNTVFPDYTNEIAKITTAGATYTATENCVVTGDIYGAPSADAHVYIDGVATAHIGASSCHTASGVFVYMKAGQTLTTVSNTSSYDLTIYGLQS